MTCAWGLCSVLFHLRTADSSRWNRLDVRGDNGQLSKLTNAPKSPAQDGSAILSIDGGQNSVAGAIRDFRENVTRLLQEQCGLLCQSQDIIRSGGPGYRLHEWISVRNSTDAKTEQPLRVRTAAGTGNQIILPREHFETPFRKFPETRRWNRTAAQLRFGIDRRDLVKCRHTSRQQLSGLRQPADGHTCCAMWLPWTRGLMVTRNGRRSAVG